MQCCNSAYFCKASFTLGHPIFVGRAQGLPFFWPHEHEEEGLDVSQGGSFIWNTDTIQAILIFLLCFFSQLDLQVF